MFTYRPPKTPTGEKPIMDFKNITLPMPTIVVKAPSTIKAASQTAVKNASPAPDTPTQSEYEYGSDYDESDDCKDYGTPNKAQVGECTYVYVHCTLGWLVSH